MIREKRVKILRVLLAKAERTEFEAERQVFLASVERLSRLWNIDLSKEPEDDGMGEIRIKIRKLTPRHKAVHGYLHERYGVEVLSNRPLFSDARTVRRHVTIQILGEKDKVALSCQLYPHLLKITNSACRWFKKTDFAKALQCPRCGQRGCFKCRENRHRLSNLVRDEESFVHGWMSGLTAQFAEKEEQVREEEQIFKGVQRFDDFLSGRRSSFEECALVRVETKKTARDWAKEKYPYAFTSDDEKAEGETEAKPAPRDQTAFDIGFKIGLETDIDRQGKQKKVNR